MGQKIKNGSVTAYEFAFRNTINDYREAWDGPVRTRPLRILRRFLLAPRTREKDAEKLEAELKKIQWLAALNEPVFDGMVELASQAWWRGGRSLGIETKPFSRNLSIPGGILISATTGYGTSAYLVEKSQKYFFLSPGEQQKKFEEKDKIGARYLASWSELGILTDETKIALNNQHVMALKSWGENLSAKNKHRPLPPRLYQLRLEGILRSDAEVRELERIALISIRKSQEEMKNRDGPFEDTEIKNKIKFALRKSTLFSERSPLEQQLLAMVLEPPVFLDGGVSNDWYQKAAAGNYTIYQARRKTSDTYWLAQLARNQTDPVLARIREDFLRNPEDWNPSFLAAYAALNFSPETKQTIPDLRQALLRR